MNHLIYDVIYKDSASVARRLRDIAFMLDNHSRPVREFKQHTGKDSFVRLDGGREDVTFEELEDKEE